MQLLHYNQNTCICTRQVHTCIISMYSNYFNSSKNVFEICSVLLLTFVGQNIILQHILKYILLIAIHCAFVSKVIINKIFILVILIDYLTNKFFIFNLFCTSTEIYSKNAQCGKNNSVFLQDKQFFKRQQEFLISKTIPKIYIIIRKNYW